VLQSELLLEATADLPLAERAADINHAAKCCVRIVRNFLRLAHQTAPERTRVQLNSVIAEALQLFAYALRLDNIDVYQYLADDLPALWPQIPGRFGHTVLMLGHQADRLSLEVCGIALAFLGHHWTPPEGIIPLFSQLSVSIKPQQRKSCTN
jgi:hypothetical protein